MSFRYNTERCIAEIQARPCLWNPNLDEYNDRIAKTKAWQEIAEILYDDWMELKVPQRFEKIKELQKKWKGLRDYYIRKNYNTKAPVTDSARKKRRAPFLEMLSFLSVTRTPNESPSDTTKVSETAPTKIEFEESQSSDASYQGNFEEQETDELPVFPEVLLKSDDRRSDKNDADKSFLLSILPEMRTMTPRQNFQFRFDIMNLIKTLKYDNSNQI